MRLAHWQMLRAAPKLRAFAVYLLGNRLEADLLVNRTLATARRNADAVVDGTNPSGYLFAILRHLYSADYRRRREASLPVSTAQSVSTR